MKSATNNKNDQSGPVSERNKYFLFPNTKTTRDKLVGATVVYH